MRDRKITLQGLNQLRLWIEIEARSAGRAWYKDFGWFKLYGQGKYPRTFFLSGPTAIGRKL
jgi:hypothetical protein